MSKQPGRKTESVRLREMRRIVPLLVLYLVGATYVAMTSGAVDCGSNHLVSAPIGPFGPDSTWLGNTETYRTVALSARERNLRYVFAWGDGNHDTTGYYPSGDTASASKTWSSVGKFSVFVKAIDVDGFRSPWSEGLQVHVYPDTD